MIEEPNKWMWDSSSGGVGESVISREIKCELILEET